MALIDHIAPWRAQDTCAKPTRIMVWLRWIHNWQKRRRHPHIAKLPPHLARDIGMSEGEMAQHQHRWPSQETHHPYG